MLFIDYDSIQIPQNIFVALSFFFLKKLPHPLSFLENIFPQASSWVLIFIKKIGFSLGKVGLCCPQKSVQD